MKAILLPTAVSLLFAAGCASQARLPSPSSRFGEAAPVGFDPNIRLATTDRKHYLVESSRFFGGVRKAATDGSVDILTLSGGGSGGAFGAGVLVGLAQTRARSQYELVGGVSVGALVAPFAFLGPQWDAKLTEAFSSDERLLRSPGTGSLLWSFVRGPGGRRGHPLDPIVDRIVTPELLEAVARETESGRGLVVATTDLDRQETILWDMGAIARKGGEPARQLFRSVLLASASVPGIFPPVLIRVQDGGGLHDELHADGSITTSLFAGPLVARILSGRIPELQDAHVYVIVNGQLAPRSSSTPLQTSAILQRTFSAAMTYKLRQDVAGFIDLARNNGMQLHLAEIPADYPVGNFLDFTPSLMKALFAYGQRCASEGRVWLTPVQSIQRNLEAPVGEDTQAADERCPADADSYTPDH